MSDYTVVCCCSVALVHERRNWTPSLLRYGKLRYPRRVRYLTAAMPLLTVAAGLNADAAIHQLSAVVLKWANTCPANVVPSAQVAKRMTPGSAAGAGAFAEKVFVCYAVSLAAIVEFVRGNVEGAE